MATTNLIGEYECKLDEKGRIIFPSALKKQLAPELQDKFVINVGFEGCLVIRPMDVWYEVSGKVNRMSEFSEDSRRFQRRFNKGANEVCLDSQNRFLIPKILIPEASIEKEVILFAYGDKIELWDKATYRKSGSMSAEEYSQSADNLKDKMV